MLLQLSVIHDNITNLSIFQHNLLLVKLLLHFLVPCAQVHQQLLISCNPLFNQLKQVLLPLQVLFQFINFFFVNGGNVLFFIFTVNNYLLLEQEIRLQLIPLLSQNSSAIFPEFVLLGNLGQGVLYLGIELCIHSQNILYNVFIDFQSGVKVVIFEL